jgi:glycosyltransferase involved in cell wall biosynthesis
MRIGIDCTAALRQGGGIGRYTRGLVRALARLDRHNEYVLFAIGRGPAAGYWSLLAGGQPPGRSIAPPANVHLKAVPLSDRILDILWHRLCLPLPVELFTGPLDLYHAPNFVLPPTYSARTILTVHDLSFLRLPECADARLRAYLSQAVPRSVARADHVLADSESTRRDVLELLGKPSDKVTVVPAGVDEHFRRVSDEEELARVRRRYDLPSRFILSLSTLEPRKNFGGLIRAFGQLLRERGGAYRGHLVIAGGKGWMYGSIFAEVEEQGLGGYVHFPGFVDDVDLPVLYSLADLFAFPSFYEGFGLPVLEAMACGTPVVCADNSSLPEIAGDAALLIKAEDTAGLVEAMRRLLADQELRQGLIERGLEQARRFTWDSAAQKLLEVYRVVV